MARQIKMPLDRKAGLGPSDIVLDGDPTPPRRKRRQSPQFSARLLCPNGWIDLDATWYGGRLRPRTHCARWGPRSPSPKRGPSCQFLAHVCCGQTARWIKMPLGTKVDLGSGRIVLHGDPAPPPKRGTAPSPNFQPMSTVANGRPSQLLLSTCYAVIFLNS